MDEKEAQAYERWVEERRAKHRKKYAIEQELRRYEEQQRYRQELSAGKFSASSRKDDSESSSEQTSA